MEILLYSLLLMKDIMIAVVYLVSPVGKKIPLVHYQLLADYLVACKQEFW